MPTLSITKSYSDGSVLTEADLDLIRTDLTTFFNTTKIDSDNIQANGVQGSKLNSNVVDNSTLQYTSSQLSIKDSGVTTAKINNLAVSRAKVATIDQIPAGCVQLFHTFNGAVSIPRGWMPLDGDTVTEANYEATHGAGTYATDGVASSALLNKNLPNMASKFPVGAASTTQDGSAPITYAGNASNQINIEHSHTMAHTHQLVSAGTLYADVAPPVFTYHELTTAGVSTPSTGNSGSTTQSIQPHSCAFIYIMKVI